MNVLTGYIVREILKGSFVAVVLLLTLFNLFTFSDQLKDLGKGHYGLTEIFYYVALGSPSVFYELMPASALLGSLFILGAMGNNRELIAMRAAGLSILGIIRAVMAAGAILVLISILVGEFIAPEAERMAQMIKVTAVDEGKIIMSAKYGLWLREGKKFINVRTVQDDGSLADISIYEIDDQRHLRHSTHAEKAVFQGNEQWKLDQIKQSDISIEQMAASHQSEQIWRSTVAPDLLDIVVVNPNNLSMYDLAMYIDFLKDNHQKSHDFELAFWGRVVNPLVVFVMLLVSAPFVIGVKRGVNVGGRMMIGVVIGMTFNIIDKIVGHLGLIYDLNPPFMAVAPSLIALAAALYALGRVQA
ncbi:LPS export ABC transporter permease LptG [Methylobacter sp. Wu8]|uniref:Lipopolysaccharide export system permease protein n=1 Tax=Methylobacter tundripaludum TaxID=173365 RepID=A0A2S6H7Q9_9GAMM|nr:LPS export ABC transporter permease LptG [Methylobacter tundripaludum]MCK9636349.1 LPS export ABC transporter permease LptG [Methylobacter tundripaludum]PPK73515.1 lipopolysaccharide export system permease protein [Methylobacter tundripaludum]